MVSEERLEQLERSLHLAGNALQAANNRIASLESAAGTSTAAEVRPKIHRSGDSTSLNDGWMNTVLLLVALTVKVGVR